MLEVWNHSNSNSRFTTFSEHRHKFIHVHITTATNILLTLIFPDASISVQAFAVSQFLYAFYVSVVSLSSRFALFYL